jgi:phage terminase Nu1 subunit (DNA packaging protein)
LTAQGVIERRADGKFDQDVSPLSFIKHLREQHRHTPRAQADAAHIAAKTEMLQLRLMQARRELVRRDDVDALIGQIAGVTLTALSSLPARCARRGDLAIRRSVERVVFEVRTEIANVCQQMADKCGEPPLDEQD